MTETPLISVIIPVKPGGRASALAGVCTTDYPAAVIEVLVAEGRQPSRQRNRAAAVAAGEYIYFLDDDSQVAPGFLQRAVRHFSDPAVAAVGGPSLTPDTDSVLQHSFAMAFASVFGGGGMRNRYRQTGGVRQTCDRELILCNLSFRKARFLALGGFDERLYPNEENELLERIRRDGGRLIHDPDLAVFRSQRPTSRAFCRQLYGYGRGRGEQTVLSGIVKPITFIPSLFLLYLILLPMAHKAVYYLPLLCYLILTLSITVFEGIRSGRLRSALLLPVVFFFFHLCYGIGMIRGLCSRKWKQEPPGEVEVTIRRVKEFGGEWKTEE
jgi:glycosyltransferase involved in cell wall biosynthesis